MCLVTVCMVGDAAELEERRTDTENLRMERPKGSTPHQINLQMHNRKPLGTGCKIIEALFVQETIFFCVSHENGGCTNEGASIRGTGAQLRRLA